MLSIISPAKTFATKGKKPIACPIPVTRPKFLADSLPIVEATLALDKDYLGQQLSLTPKMRDEAYRTWRTFVSGEEPPKASMLLYSGMVFKKLSGATLSAEDWLWAQEHLLICSFVYGLLRPSDGILPYRMEGTADLAWGHETPLFHYWRSRLTDYLIERICASGGTLLYLASEEMKQLFHWGQVERAVRVITPRFLTQTADGTLKQIVIYTKMARGSMARHVIEKRLEHPDPLKDFSPEGFVFSAEHSAQDEWVYILPAH